MVDGERSGRDDQQRQQDDGDLSRAEVAATTGAQVAELYGELEPGQYIGGEDCLHPNAAGHAEIAELLYATLAR